jgi:hypothetical protein
MELKNDDFQALQNKVDQISSELEKQNIVRIVNTKWVIIVGSLILGALGFTSFVQIPREANRAAKEQVGPEIKAKALNIIDSLENYQTTAKEIEAELTKVSELDKIANLPIGTIVPSMLDTTEFANAVGDTNRETNEWVLAEGQNIPATSQYAQLSKKTKAPDLRGMFLRGVAEGREAGSHQDDAFKSHQHKFKSAGKATSKKWRGSGTAPVYIAYHAEGLVESEGDVETRPKNVAVYYYIKIN